MSINRKPFKYSRLGVSMILQFYLFLILLYLLPLYIFSTHLVILGEIISEPAATIFHISVVVFLGLLYFSVKYKKIVGIFLGVFFHSLFLINGFLMLVKWPVIIMIKGIYPIQTIAKAFFIILMMVLNSIIISYFLCKKRYFIDK